MDAYKEDNEIKRKWTFSQKYNDPRDYWGT